MSRGALEYVAVRPQDLAEAMVKRSHGVLEFDDAMTEAQAILDYIAQGAGEDLPALVVDDVREFSRKFGLPTPGSALMPDQDLHGFRWKFMKEELDELDLAWARGDLVSYLDALVDLVYVAVGTAIMCGMPFDQAWHAVQRANMAKERATGADDPRSTRPHVLNVVKPAGWVGPSAAIATALLARGAPPRMVPGAEA